MADDLHMGGLDDLEVAAFVDQGLASLIARFEDREFIRDVYPDLSAEQIEDLATAVRRTCDEWDRVADNLPGFREP